MKLFGAEVNKAVRWAVELWDTKSEPSTTFQSGQWQDAWLNIVREVHKETFKLSEAQKLRAQRAKEGGSKLGRARKQMPSPRTIFDRVQKGEPVKELAKEFGCSPYTVRNRIKEYEAERVKFWTKWAQTIKNEQYGRLPEPPSNSVAKEN